MKISMMTNDQAADAMIKMAKPISNLMQDEEAVKLLETIKSPREDESGIAYFARILPQLVSFGMQNHKDDVFAIVAALTMKPVSEIGKMNFISTVKELRESIDEDLIGFFKQSGEAMKAPGN